MNITAEFLLNSGIPVEWADLLWGYKRGLLGWNVPVEFAKAKVASSRYLDPLVSELAGTVKDQDWRVSRLLEKMVNLDFIPRASSSRVWLYLVLLWTYERQDEYENVFDRLFEIYADFDYPDEIRSFAGFWNPGDNWNPMEDGHVRWANYLEQARRRLY